MRLFAQNRMLAVADSNRFEDSDGTLAVLDVRNLSASSNGVPLKTLRAGKFPRNIGISHDGKTLFLTNYTSRTLQVIRIVNR
jgi:DNA-binding beta-propeller fold protein YncE